MSERQPSIGRIVHYRRAPYMAGGAPVMAAIIVGLNDDETVNLQIFQNSLAALIFENAVAEAASAGQAQPGQWFWPPRVA